MDRQYPNGDAVIDLLATPVALLMVADAMEAAGYRDAAHVIPSGVYLELPRRVTLGTQHYVETDSGSWVPEESKGGSVLLTPGEAEYTESVWGTEGARARGVRCEI